MDDKHQYHGRSPNTVTYGSRTKHLHLSLEISVFGDPMNDDFYSYYDYGSEEFVSTNRDSYVDFGPKYDFYMLPPLSGCPKAISDQFPKLASCSYLSHVFLDPEEKHNNADKMTVFCDGPVFDLNFHSSILTYFPEPSTSYTMFSRFHQNYMRPLSDQSLGACVCNAKSVDLINFSVFSEFDDYEYDLRRLKASNLKSFCEKYFGEGSYALIPKSRACLIHSLKSVRTFTILIEPMYFDHICKILLFPMLPDSDKSNINLSSFQFLLNFAAFIQDEIPNLIYTKQIRLFYKWVLGGLFYSMYYLIEQAEYDMIPSWIDHHLIADEFRASFGFIYPSKWTILRMDGTEYVKPILIPIRGLVKTESLGLDQPRFLWEILLKDTFNVLHCNYTPDSKLSSILYRVTVRSLQSHHFIDLPIYQILCSYMDSGCGFEFSDLLVPHNGTNVSVSHISDLSMSWVHYKHGIIYTPNFIKAFFICIKDLVGRCILEFFASSNPSRLDILKDILNPVTVVKFNRLSVGVRALNKRFGGLLL